MTSVVTPQVLPTMMTAAVGPSQMSAAPSRRITKAIFGLALTKLCLAVVIVIWLSVLLAYGFVLSLYGFLTAIGVVIVLLVTAAIGLTASKIPSPCWFIAFLVLAVMSAFFAANVMVAYSVGAAIDSYSDNFYRWENDCQPRQDYESYDYGDTGDWVPDDCWNYQVERTHRRHLVLAMYGLVIGCFFVEMIIAIVASAFSCHALCNCCRKDTGMRIAYMMPVHTGGYLQQLAVPTGNQNPQCTPILESKDLYPLDIPMDQDDVVPRNSRPPSYVSLDEPNDEEELAVV